MASSSDSSNNDNNNISSTSSKDDLPRSPPSDQDMAQVFTELARGEKTAQALESHLASLEKKIDDLLASVEDGQPPAPPPSDGQGHEAGLDGASRTP